MALMGKAALAMWWDMAPAMRREFEDWHSHEHFRERLAIPGFLRANRWNQRDEGEGVFQLYELDNHEVVSSPAYLERLNDPSPWSTKMMPHHRNMVRSQCVVLASCGGSVARYLLTVRLSPLPARAEVLQAALRADLAQLVDQAGCVGGHLLRHQAPSIAVTKEQVIRGGDLTADWVLLVMGYDAQVLEGLSHELFSESELLGKGATSGTWRGMYELSYSATAASLI